MKKILLSTIALMFAVTMAALAQTPQKEPSAIVTQGTATVKHAPDRAWVTVAVEGRDSKADNARQQAATQMTTVQNAIKALGIPVDAIKTTGFSLQQQMEWDGTRSRPGNYVAHNQIEIRIDKLEQAGSVLDAAGSIKTTANLSVSISGFRFDLKNPDVAEKEALKLAVTEALGRAQAIAEAAKRPLGAILRIEDQRISQGPVFPVMATMRMEKAAADTPVAPGEIEVRASVSVTVAIQ
jgi:uncharacterized protein YggE